jgi:hypothetical protein
MRRTIHSAFAVGGYIRLAAIALAFILAPVPPPSAGVHRVLLHPLLRLHLRSVTPSYNVPPDSKARFTAALAEGGRFLFIASGAPKLASPQEAGTLITFSWLGPHREVGSSHSCRAPPHPTPAKVAPRIV